MTAENLTTPETAQKILGENFISLEETLKIFPRAPAELTGYDTIPFSRELLYYCSEPEHPFILFPAMSRCGKIPLTIFAMRQLTDGAKYDLFAPWSREVDLYKPMFLTQETCESRWHLVSKAVLDHPKLKKFCDAHEFCYENFEAERAVVYVYAWLLWRIAKRETLFLDNPVRTLNNFATRPGYATMAYLTFKSGKVAVGQWRPNPKAPGGFEPGYAASVDPFTE